MHLQYWPPMGPRRTLKYDPHIDLASLVGLWHSMESSIAFQQMSIRSLSLVHWESFHLQQRQTWRIIQRNMGSSFKRPRWRRVPLCLKQILIMRHELLCYFNRSCDHSSNSSHHGQYYRETRRKNVASASI